MKYDAQVCTYEKRNLEWFSYRRDIREKAIDTLTSYQDFQKDR